MGEPVTVVDRASHRQGVHPWENREYSPSKSHGALDSERRAFHSLDLGRIFKYPFTAGLTYFLVFFYLFLEYVRPQVIYPALDVIPWAQVTLIIAGISLLMSGKAARRFVTLDYLLFFFAAVVIASSFLAYRPSASFENLSDFFLTWLLVYWLITSTVKTERRFIVFMLAYFLWNLKMSQHAMRIFIGIGGGFQRWGATGAPGWFHNSGEMAIEMCIFLPLSWYFWLGIKDQLSRWKSLGLLMLPLSAAMAIIASSSRGGQLAAVAVVLAIIFKSKRRIRGLLVGATIAAIGFLLLPQEQIDRFSEMGSDKNSVSRLTYWSDALEIMNEYPVLGIGYKNWVPYYRNFYNSDGELPHNIFLEAGAELGYIGLLALFGLIGGTFIMNRRTRGLASNLPGPSRDMFSSMAHGLDVALIGFMVSGFFVTVLYYPFLWVNLAFTAALFLSAQREYGRSLRDPKGAMGGRSLWPR